MGRKYNDFDESDGAGVFDQILTIVGERKREFAIVSVSAAVILLGLVVWGTYPDDTANSSASVPIVRADAGDYKSAPDNPGGMEIPYRDSTVFSSLGNEEASGATENILAEDTTEQPVPRSQLFAGLNTEEGAAPTTAAEQPRGEVEDIEAAMVEKPTIVETPATNEKLVAEAIGTAPSEEKLAAAPAAKAAPVVEKPAVTEEAAAAKTEPAAGSVAAKAVTPGGYYIQVGSVRSEAGVAGEWKKIQAKFPAQLNTLQYRTQEANLGAKGIFHRIQAGPMSKESADKICGEMKVKAAGSCLVTK